ncbi:MULTISPECIES: DNA-methyltransferase [Micromonospora]|uniref:DNA-methyltransferase n=1 Tax=Micromonospora TaxID=1873 RepID=UPI0033ED343E
MSGGLRDQRPDGLTGYEYHRAGPVTLYLGDARRVLAAMPDASVDAVVTSPPFWSLRDYGTGRWVGGDPGCLHAATQRLLNGAPCGRCPAVWSDPQYGLEATVEQYVDRLVGVFDEVRRVLSPTGTCWLNLGDSYSAPGRRAEQTLGVNPVPGSASTLPVKNLIGVPWRVAFALQASGWWLRNAVIWSKTNPMPESVRDRLSTTYELLFLLTTSPTYYFDLDPIRLPLARPEAVDGTRIIGGARKGATGGVGATARRRGATAYGGNTPPTPQPNRVRLRATSSRSGTPTPPRTRGAATPGTCGASRLAPTAAPTSPLSPSTFPCGPSPPVVHPVAWS